MNIRAEAYSPRGAMDVYTQQETRILALIRKLPPALDAVIDQAKREAEMDSAQEARDNAARNNRRRMRRAGQAAAMIAETRGGTAPTGAASPKARSPGAKGPKRRKYRTGEVRRAVPASAGGALTSSAVKPPAQLIQGERSETFGSAVDLFNGRSRRFPHEADQSKLRSDLGASIRHAALNDQLREARAKKYDADIAAMAALDKLSVETMKRQADGALLRYGRLDAAWDGRLQFNGHAHKRGQILTWKWTAGFYVLCEGLLHEFPDTSLTSPLVASWPVLGATLSKVMPSSQQFPYVIQLHVNSYFIEESVLATVEFAVETPQERARWIEALSRAALGVSALFRDTTDKEVHIAEVDSLDTEAAYDVIGRRADAPSPPSASRGLFRRRPKQAMEGLDSEGRLLADPEAIPPSKQPTPRLSAVARCG